MFGLRFHFEKSGSIALSAVEITSVDCACMFRYTVGINILDEQLT